MNSKNDNKKELLYAGALKLLVISFFEEEKFNHMLDAKFFSYVGKKMARQFLIKTSC